MLLKKDKYTSLSKIGKGSFGNVFKVREKNTSKIFACKKIRVKNIGNKERSYILNEINILYNNSCKYLLKCYDFFYQEGFVYIITDYCEEKDIRVLIDTYKNRRECMSEKRILKLLSQLVHGLYYIHNNNLIHRDIKPANIFLAKNQQINIGDVGICKFIINKNRTCIGTPMYMSPEQINGKHYDHKIDSWAIGCILFELMTHKHAFNGISIQNLNFNIKKKYNQPWKKELLHAHYSNGLKTIVRRCLEPDKVKRIDVKDLIENENIKNMTWVPNEIRFKFEYLKKDNINLFTTTYSWDKDIEKIKNNGNRIKNLISKPSYYNYNKESFVYKESLVSNILDIKAPQKEEKQIFPNLPLEKKNDNNCVLKIKAPLAYTPIIKDLNLPALKTIREYTPSIKKKPTKNYPKNVRHIALSPTQPSLPKIRFFRRNRYIVE